MSSIVESHHERIARMREAFREAHGRFVARLRDTPRDLLTQASPDGGWSVAQIGWHVAAVDGAFAGLISGARRSQVLPAGFVERRWTEIAASVPDKLEASGPVVPPADVDVDGVLQSLDAAARQLDDALQSLTPDRGTAQGVTHQAVGTITLYQVGDWAVAHTIRHNAQAKRLLARLAPPRA